MFKKTRVRQIIELLQKKIENVYSGRRVVRYPSPVYFEKNGLLNKIK